MLFISILMRLQFIIFASPKSFVVFLNSCMRGGVIFKGPLSLYFVEMGNKMQSNTLIVVCVCVCNNVLYSDEFSLKATARIFRCSLLAPNSMWCIDIVLHPTTCVIISIRAES